MTDINRSNTRPSHVLSREINGKVLCFVNCEETKNLKKKKNLDRNTIINDKNLELFQLREED